MPCSRRPAEVSGLSRRKRAAKAKNGDAPKRNDLIRKTDESGSAEGMPGADQHLHFEIHTVAHPRLGLQDRISPMKLFGKCPLTQAISG
jgi:hypothetical protein